MDTKRKLGVMKEIEAANKRHVEEWKREQAGRKITGVLVDVKTGTVAKATVEKNLDSYISTAITRFSTAAASTSCGAA
mgnify:CR=1 FL=1